ncbi:hypothetical protein MHYP_G00323710 [Metynnis hypsauchen]
MTTDDSTLTLNALLVKECGRSEGSGSSSAPYLQETEISTLVAGMFPVMGSNSHTEAMSSSLSVTSPSMGAGSAELNSTPFAFFHTPAALRLPLNAAPQHRSAALARATLRTAINSTNTAHYKPHALHSTAELLPKETENQAEVKLESFCGDRVTGFRLNTPRFTESPDITAGEVLVTVSLSERSVWKTRCTRDSTAGLNRCTL